MISFLLLLGRLVMREGNRLLLRDEGELADAPAVWGRRAEKTVADRDVEVGTVVFDKDLVEVGRDWRVEGFLVLAPEVGRACPGVGACEMGGTGSVRKDAEDTFTAIAVAEQGVDGVRHGRILLSES
jgi:hypothetical protein